MVTLSFEPTPREETYVQKELGRLAAKGETLTAEEYLTRRLRKLLQQETDKIAAELRALSSDAIAAAIASLPVSMPSGSKIVVECEIDEDGKMTAAVKEG